MKNASIAQDIIIAFALIAVLAIAVIALSDYAEYESYIKSELIGFSDNSFKSIEETITKDHLTAFISKYDQYNSHIYFGSLNPDEKLVYHIFEYALENAHEYVFIDNRILDRCYYSAYDILKLFSLDSPIVEQNLQVEFTAVCKEFSSWNTKISALSVRVKNFSSAKLAKKEEAISRAKEIVSAMPQGMKDVETMEYFFNYLIDTITYTSYDDKASANYLYDALISNKTICDGYSNAFSLLAHIYGLDCCEKYYLKDKNGDPGHTWDCVLLDGNWYNINPTVTIPTGEKMKELSDDYKSTFLYNTFCFSDDYCDVPAEYYEIAPRCESNLFFVGDNSTY